AEWALRQPAVGGAREDGAHLLEIEDVAGRLPAHDLDRILVAEVVGALDGVERVALGRVLRRIAEGGVDAALRRPGVRPGRVALREHAHVDAASLCLAGPWD